MRARSRRPTEARGRARLIAPGTRARLLPGCARTVIVDRRGDQTNSRSPTSTSGQYRYSALACSSTSWAAMAEAAQVAATNGPPVALHPTRTHARAHRRAVAERSIGARTSGHHNALRDLRRIAENQITALATSRLARNPPQTSWAPVTAGTWARPWGGRVAGTDRTLSACDLLLDSLFVTARSAPSAQGGACEPREARS